jgi:hypothetical protein
MSDFQPQKQHRQLTGKLWEQLQHLLGHVASEPEEVRDASGRRYAHYIIGQSLRSLKADHQFHTLRRLLGVGEEQQQEQGQLPQNQTQQQQGQEQGRSNGGGVVVEGGGALEWGHWTPVPNVTAVTLLHLPSGGYSLSARAVDAAGNVGKPCEPIYFTVRACIW